MGQVISCKYTTRIIDTSGLLRVLVTNNISGAVVMDDTCRDRPGPILQLSDPMKNLIKIAVSNYKCNEVICSCRPAAAYVKEIMFGG